MIVARTIADCRAARADLGRIGFVPTMGALHEGHLSLVEHARRHADHVAVSIFVNPTQFGPNEDYTRYPRPLEDDVSLCRAAGVDLVFAPDVTQMYPTSAPRVAVDVPALSTVLDGAHRPGHFAGVCQVVAKLFGIVQPQAACFGEKDYQQLAVLHAMTRGLDLPIQIVGCPTLRDPDGLAMSSRNRYLSPTERQRALSISRGLFEIQRRVAAGERAVRPLADALRTIVLDGASLPAVPTTLDYATIVDADSLQPVDVLADGQVSRALVALRVGTTRLIDNVALSVTSR